MDTIREDGLPQVSQRCFFSRPLAGEGVEMVLRNLQLAGLQVETAGPVPSIIADFRRPVAVLRAPAGCRLLGPCAEASFAHVPTHFNTWWSDGWVARRSFEANKERYVVLLGGPTLPRPTEGEPDWSLHPEVRHREVPALQKVRDWGLTTPDVCTCSVWGNVLPVALAEGVALVWADRGAEVFLSHPSWVTSLAFPHWGKALLEVKGVGVNARTFANPAQTGVKFRASGFALVVAK